MMCFLVFPSLPFSIVAMIPHKQRRQINNFNHMQLIAGLVLYNQWNPLVFSVIL